MSKLVKVENHGELRRDDSSQAIINVDKQQYTAYKRKKYMAKQKAERLNNVESKVNKLQEDMKDIKQLLQQLVAK